MSEIPVSKNVFRTEGGIFLWRRRKSGGLEINQNPPDSIHLMTYEGGRNGQRFVCLDGRNTVSMVNPSGVKTSGQSKTRGVFKKNVAGEFLTIEALAELEEPMKKMCKSCFRRLQNMLSESEISPVNLEQLIDLPQATMPRPTKDKIEKKTPKVTGEKRKTPTKSSIKKQNEETTKILGVTIQSATKNYLISIRDDLNKVIKAI